MNRKRIEALRVVASEKIYKILGALRIDYKEKYQYITSACPVHQGDREDAWSWHLDKESWSCWSRGCHDTHGKDVFGLVKGVLDCSFPDACVFVEKVFDGQNLNIDELAQLQSNKQFIKNTKKKAEAIVYPESTLDKLFYHRYLEGRGYPKELVESYQIGITDSRYKQMSNRLIVPVRNIDGQIVGFTGRALGETNYGKWVHSKGFIAAENLFNIDKSKGYIEDSGEAILVEGPFDVLRLEQAGIHNSVALFGRKLHNGQISLLAKCCANKLIIALDADNAGKTGAESALQTAKAFFGVKIIDLQNGDVGSLSIDKAKEIFSEIRN